jgi:ATP-dependent DNA helicase RecG
MDWLSYMMQPVTVLHGVGEKLAEKLNAYMARQKKIPAYRATVQDMLFHAPYDYVDRRSITPLVQASEGLNTLRITVLKHFAPPPQRYGRHPVPYRVQCEDDTGSLMLVFFKAEKTYLEKQLPIGQQVVISGHLQRYDGMWQMNHPDVMVSPEKAQEVCRLQGIYPATDGVPSRILARIAATACTNLPESGEWLRDSTVQHHRWPSHTQSIRSLHQPDALEKVALAKARLAYDEALAHQLALRVLRQQEQKQGGVVLSLRTEAMQRTMQQLPFALTEGQEKLLQEIEADISSGARMLRLLQGDVGAGKTVIAALTMLAAANAGYQAVLMAPTEILARQHLHAMDALLGLNAAPVIFLAGSLTLRQREEAREKLRTHPAALVIGTHALFQQGVEFANLALVVIDEQHRFGVNQRIALSDKGLKDAGKAPHVLLMTATPIPRSLAMAWYGDLDVSLLTQKPANRLPIETLAMGLGKLEALCAGIARALMQGEKIYWICPLVEEIEVSAATSPLLASLQAAESRAQALNILFPNKVGLIHGRMSMAEREPVMQAFVRGDIHILVATTVVEVGVDVPDATVMVIENAERFGLAQLHQLRGRVGRGAKPSRCILLYQERCSQTAKERLKIMRHTTDGFVIAEADLKLRGSGELLGTRQTGVPEYRFIQLEQHADMLAAAKQEATLALNDDPLLETERGQRLQQLLALFQLDDAVRYLRSG